jgi:hypothetical protein
MKKTILNISLLGILAAAIVAAPWTVSAQDSGAKAPTSPDQSAPAKHNKKHEHLVFNGKVTAVDHDAMTVTVGKRTFEITSETKITKDDKPATLSDVVVGEKIGGAYKKSDGGKLTATTIHIGAKSGGASSEGEKKHKKKNGSDSTDTDSGSDK